MQIEKVNVAEFHKLVTEKIMDLARQAIEEAEWSAVEPLADAAFDYAEACMGDNPVYFSSLNTPEMMFQFFIMEPVNGVILMESETFKLSEYITRGWLEDEEDIRDARDDLAAMEKTLSAMKTKFKEAFGEDYD